MLPNQLYKHFVRILCVKSVIQCRFLRENLNCCVYMCVKKNKSIGTSWVFWKGQQSLMKLQIILLSTALPNVCFCVLWMCEKSPFEIISNPLQSTYVLFEWFFFHLFYCNKYTKRMQHILLSYLFWFCVCICIIYKQLLLKRAKTGYSPSL